VDCISRKISGEKYQDGIDIVDDIVSVFKYSTVHVSGGRLIV